MAVFIADVDDYLAPSQACVNPLFSTDKDKEKEKDSSEGGGGGGGGKKEPAAAAANGGAVGVVPRAVRRRGRGAVRRPAAVVGSSPDSSAAAAAAVPPQVPGIVPGFPAPTTATAASTEQAGGEGKEAVVKASIADCLACSGCVTTAETVLLESHSLDALREKISKDAAAIGVTISPASSADLIRRLLLGGGGGCRGEEPDAGGADDASGVAADLLDLDVLNCRLATMLCRRMKAHAVLDGNLPLTWSLNSAADEFCRAYRHREKGGVGGGGEANGHGHQHAPSQENQQLPLITSSCPALVCLAEKTLHESVPHLSHVKSPMAAGGGSFWKRKGKENREGNGGGNCFFHVAIMPCHDKKLEASRPELDGDVDLVVTTDECLQLLKETASKDEKKEKKGGRDKDTASNGGGDAMDVDDDGDDDVVEVDPVAVLRDELLSLPPAPVRFCRRNSEAVDWASLRGSFVTAAGTVNPAAAESGGGADTATDFFAASSGGYADYVFRHACRTLFGVTVPPGVGVWKPAGLAATASAVVDDATSNGGAVGPRKKPQQQSARTAAAAQRRRQLYQATLYRDDETGSCLGSWELADDEGAGTTPPSSSSRRRRPVLRFAIAHGMQTMQRALEPFSEGGGGGRKKAAGRRSNRGGAENGGAGSSDASSSRQCPYDYLEAMACPSGCANGGGQIRLADRETPTQTRQRVTSTRRCFASPDFHSKGVEEVVGMEKDLGAAGHDDDDDSDDSNMRTTYRVVEPLQLQMGATAGVAVKDVQW